MQAVAVMTSRLKIKIKRLVNNLRRSKMRPPKPMKEQQPAVAEKEKVQLQAKRMAENENLYL
jgi:hypothetical protein